MQHSRPCAYSILGMHLFGCKFCFVNQYGERECDRKNFDSLLWAFVTVFQVCFSQFSLCGLKRFFQLVRSEKFPSLLRAFSVDV